MPCLFNDKAVVPLPALFTRSCCFHQELSTTSSATRATKSLYSLFISEKAGVGGSTPSLATIYFVSRTSNLQSSVRSRTQNAHRSC
jgi:hypothetical protein